MNLNKVFLIGRLTADPEKRTTPSGVSICNFRIATNMFWRDKNSGEKKEKTEFHNIVAWRGLADIVCQYLNKGSLVFIEGRIETRNWEGTDGIKHYKTEIIADNLQLGPRTNRIEDLSSQRENPEKEKSQDDIPIIEEKTEEEIDPKNIPL